MIWSGILILLLAAPALAAPDRSPRPSPRPVEMVFRTSPGPVYSDAPMRPVPRPEGAAGLRPVVMVRPSPRPVKMRPVEAETRVLSRAPRGGVCGGHQIEGEALAPISGRLRGCEIARPVRVTRVSGVALKPAAVLDCSAAQALADWVENSVKPAVRRLGGGAGGLRVAAGYACRTRNNRPGGKLSEHAKGRAVDISAIVLKNGKSIPVLSGWNDVVAGKILRQVHREACGPFKTVLGPEADRYHKDHLHLDVAQRAGRYCR
ncbi:hypothetical protein C8N32_103235 [Rhodovulum imhoffii]|uniref:Extensin-like C-terminal domain-containing protein n=1 Tax=Rhodovulum imhoffii TaxID=365340 RepID=A0A2T5BV44_9RHOB|nr:extensin family protein [Rhodovulum imhoffii]MBK5934635.1 hypothetical protein [Rhodovulum imhoffii]PTN03391.1 hypothetical protein C8N32_103235 [Rhodovulum imhoffii]